MMRIVLSLLLMAGIAAGLSSAYRHHGHGWAHHHHCEPHTAPAAKP